MQEWEIWIISVQDIIGRNEHWERGKNVGWGLGSAEGKNPSDFSRGCNDFAGEKFHLCHSGWAFECEKLQFWRRGTLDLRSGVVISFRVPILMRCVFDCSLWRRWSSLLGSICVLEIGHLLSILWGLSRTWWIVMSFRLLHFFSCMTHLWKELWNLMFLR